MFYGSTDRHAECYRVPVTVLDNFARMRNPDATWYGFTEFLRDLDKTRPVPEHVRHGTAVHGAIERAPKARRYWQDPETGYWVDVLSVERMVPAGIRYGVPEVGFVLPIQPAQGYPLFMLSGKTDLVDGCTVHDWKTTDREHPNAYEYESSVQWRAYLMALGASRAHYVRAQVFVQRVTVRPEHYDGAEHLDAVTVGNVSTATFAPAPTDPDRIRATLRDFCDTLDAFGILHQFATPRTRADWAPRA